MEKQLFRWHSDFDEGRGNNKREHGYGRSSTSKTDEDRWSTVKTIVNEVNISKNIVFNFQQMSKT